MKSQLNLPSPPAQYSQNDQAQTRRLIADEDLRNIKTNDVATTLVPGVVKVDGTTIAVDTTGKISLADYTEGTWTPADASGANLTLTVNKAVYRRFGNSVFVQADVSYPSNANGSAASWSGLPYASATDGQGTAIVMSNTTLAALGGTGGNASTVVFLQFSGSNQINSNLSLVRVRFSGWYSLN